MSTLVPEIEQGALVVSFDIHNTFACLLSVAVSVHMYIRLCVCTFVCMCVCSFVCMYVRLYVCMFVCMYACSFVCMCALMYKRIHVHAYMHTCINDAYMYKRIHVQIHRMYI